MATTKLGLPTITGNMTADVVRDVNALAEAVDGKAGAAGGLATLGSDGKVPAGQLNVDTSNLATKTEVSTLNQKVDEHQAEKASKTEYGHVMVGEGLSVTAGVISANIPDLEASNVSTTSGSNVQTEIDSLKLSVNDGKNLVKNAIIGKGGNVLDGDGDGVSTFSELEAGVNGIPTPNPMNYPNNQSFNLLGRVCGITEDKIYVVRGSGSTALGEIYDHNLVLLQSFSHPYGVKTIYENGYITGHNVNPYYALHDLNGVFVKTLYVWNPSFVGTAMRESSHAFVDTQSSLLKIHNYNDLQLWSGGGQGRLFTNKKRNFVWFHTGTTNAEPSMLLRFTEEMTPATYNGTNHWYFIFDYVNW